uniref:Uncharacterized protein n=1 Tax=Coturnix japonica TaxID=93934 RepID=A0A8C2TX94_COTJA
FSPPIRSLPYFLLMKFCAHLTSLYLFSQISLTGVKETSQQMLPVHGCRLPTSGSGCPGPHPSWP